MQKPVIALAGATGYVGSRLLEALEAANYPVRCLARRPTFLSDRVGKTTTIIKGDCLDASTLGPLLRGVDCAFYLVHSMGSEKDFAEQDRRAALNFSRAAREAGVKRIVYLGGLGDSSEELSRHLKSRHETGDVLRSTGIPVIELRASIILGSGSLSYELIRALVERLPVMVCPNWVRMKAQPIHIEDVVTYLIASMKLPESDNRVFEIGGEDQVSYADIMREYARQRGLRRLMIPVPLLTPYLSSLWLGLTTPVYARVGRKLVKSIRNATVVRNDEALHVFGRRPVGMAEAIRRALRNEESRFSATRWSDAVSAGGSPPSWGGAKFGTRLVDKREVQLTISAREAFDPIRRIGGETGWYYANALWRIRGWIDLLVGGVGLRRGRRDPEKLIVGDAIDFWRVEAYEPNRRLRLVAEMKLPGRAWLEFQVEETAEGSVIHQSAVFDPVGLAGQAYWYGIYPLHRRIFAGMLRGIANGKCNLADAGATIG
ncbi:MAG: SDR family oxidoreductase [Acidobacteriota bacterium]|nr:SDR family oxidoreductase [Acidobacteriota bacterium]